MSTARSLRCLAKSHPQTELFLAMRGQYEQDILSPPGILHSQQFSQQKEIKGVTDNQHPKELSEE